MKIRTAEEILLIPASEPERLFLSNPDMIKQEYRDLARYWHPDLNRDSRAALIFAHITALYKAAVDKIRAGTWEEPNILTVESIAHGSFRFHFFKKFDFELGHCYISPQKVLYVVEDAYRDLFDVAVKELRGHPRGNDKMKQEFGRYIPRVVREIEGTKSSFLLLEKPKSLILLRDVLDHEGGNLDPRHTAWILSSLYNLLCYFNHCGVVHGDIALDTYWIDPAQHSGMLIGGWWYSAAQSTTLRALPSRTMSILPADLLKTKQATAKIDLELVHLLGRELLGDPSGMSFKKRKEVPEMFGDWMRLSSMADPVEEYKIWYTKVIPGAFGVRKFTPFKLRAEEIYKEA